MARYTKQDQFTLGGQNTENEKIATAIEDTLSRKGDSPNAMEANLDMNGYRIVNLPIPSDSQEAASKAYVDSRSAISLSDESLFKRPTDFGAVGDGVTDDTTELQAAFNSGLPIIIDQTYAFSGDLSVPTYFSCVGGGKLLYIGTDNSSFNPVVKVTAPVVGDIVIDANNKAILSMTLDGRGKEAVSAHNLFLYNVNASDPAQSVSGGVILYGNTFINAVYSSGFQNTGHTNGSFPYLVGAAEGKHTINSVRLDGGQSCFSSSVDAIFNVNTVECIDIADNVVYNLGGEFVAGHVVHRGSEEGMVNSGGVCRVGRWVSIGATGAPCDVDNAKYTEFGEIICTYPEGTAEADIPANVPSSLYYHRSLQGAADTSGPLIIGRVYGHLRTSVINTGFSSGKTDLIKIGEMDVKLYYRPSIPEWNETNFFNLEGVNECHIHNSKIDIIDSENALTTGTVTFQAQFGQSTKTRPSVIENLDFFISDTTGEDIPEARAVVRHGTQSSTLKIKGGRWQTNVGPYGREKKKATYIKGDTIINPAFPSAGYWWQGQEFLQEYYKNDTKIRVKSGGTVGVDAEFQVYSEGAPLKEYTANHTLSEGDVGGEVRMKGTSLTLTIPTNSNALVQKDLRVAILNVGTNDLTIQFATGVTGNGVLNGSCTLPPNKMSILEKADGSSSWYISGGNTSVA